MEKEYFLNQLKKINPDLKEDLVGQAFEYAREIYGDRQRLSGQTLFDHCCDTALALAGMNLGSSVVTAGLLHEAIERAGVDSRELKKKFGEEIARLVEGVTNVSKMEHRGAKRNVENLRKLFLATAQDIRVVLIKLVNRLYGLKTVYVFDDEKQKRLAQETLDIYAPLAYRLGMRRISGELEDIAFPILYPGEYHWIINQVKDRYQERERYLRKLTPIIKKELTKSGVEPIEIHSRAKRYFSLYRKLQRYNMDLNRIYDLVALRIIVKNIEDCYAALGVIHKLWRPLPGRIKDYIALPKPNGYHSLHTTVFCPDGKITEFQIRTPEMHQEAEVGIAAHWYYSERKGLKDYLKRIFTKAPEKELQWIQQLREWQKDITGSPDEFFQSLKIDFFKDRIFVFTPDGDIINLPEDATPVDFAYHIHSEIGHHCQGARVDSRFVALNTPLRNGQVVEIITQRRQQPSADWLKFVKTNLAKTRIRQWLNKNQAAPPPTSEEKPELEIKKEPPEKETPKICSIRPLPTNLAVKVNGNPKISTVLAKCCQPQPPAPIRGYITLNQRISVHQSDCPNLARLKDNNRFIRVKWGE